MSNTYRQALISAFNRMSNNAFKNGFDGNLEFCQAIIQNINGLISRSTVETKDNGAAGDYTYSGVGTLQGVQSFMDTSSILYASINSMTENNTNVDVATYIINNAKTCIEGTILSIQTTGTGTKPSSSPIVVSAIGTGKITTSTSSACIQGLAADFNKMKESNSDEDVANYITKWITNLLKAQVNSTFSSTVIGSGSGTITPN